MIVRLAPFALGIGLITGTAAGAAVLPTAGATLSGARDLGPASSTTRVRVAVVLAYHHDAELEHLTEAQADPSSPVYHRFLRPAEFRDYFAPSQAEYDRVLASLRAGGFAITHTFSNRTVVDAAAPAPVAARYFSTEIHRVISAEGARTYTNLTPPTLPASIAGLVLSVVGLDAANRPHPLYRFAPRRPARALLPQTGSEPVFGPDGGYGPLVYVNSYDLPAQNGDVGDGRASGVATDNDFLDSDLAAYVSYFGLTRTGPTTRVLVDGGPPPGLGPDSVETTLDVETIASISPGTSLYVYEAPYDEPTNANFIDIYNQVVTDNLVDTLNSSYIYCETAIDRVVHGYTRAVNAVEQQGNALGITFHAGSGDSGAYSPGCNNNIHVGESSGTPHAIAVGGTSLSVDANGNETGEVGWDGSGGGVSVIWKVPGYQKKVPTIIPSGRNVPDLAFDADPGTGESLYYDGAFDGPIGGTSLAGPIFGAGLTQLDEVQNARSGFFNATVYKVWLAHGYNSGSILYFRDITQGSIPPYSAGPGYDQMSGIGSMLFNNFITLLPR